MIKPIPVLDNPEIGRDPISGSIVNLNNDAYQNHMKQKRNREVQKSKMEELERQVYELKTLVQKLLETQK